MAEAALPHSHVGVNPPRRFGLLPIGASKYSWQALANTWATWMLNVVVFAMVYVIGVRVIKEYDLSAATWGYIIAGYLAVRVLCDLPATILSDHLGRGWARKYVWVPLMLVYVIAGTLIAVPGLANSLWVFVLLLFGVAIGTTASEAIGVVATVEWWPVEERGFAVGLHHTGYPIGALLGGWLASWIFDTVGPEHWRLAYIAALASIPFIIWYWFLSRKAAFDKVEENTRQRGLTSSIGEAHPEEHVSIRSCLAALKNRDVLIMAGCAFGFQGILNVFLTTYPEYLNFVGGYSYAEVASLSVVWAVTGAFFQFLLPTLSDRIGRKWLIIGAAMIQAVAFAILPVATSLAGVILVQLLYGTMLNAVYPLMFATTADAAGHRAGSALGAVFTALWTGAVCGTLLGTQILHAQGGFESAAAYRVVYYAMVGLSIGIVVIRLLGRETNPRVRPLHAEAASA